MNDIPDAPWIGLCREEWEERCSPNLYDEDRENYEIEQAECKLKEEREGD